ncbi:MAG: hypothetical protein ACLQGP_42130 [Isosphaeraceae bacterium]
MINVLLSRRWRSPRVRRGAICSLSLALLLFASNATMAQSEKKSTVAASQESAKSKAAARDDDDKAPAPAPDIAPGPVVDPSQTGKVEPIEVFKDPAIEVLQLLDVNKFKPLQPVPYTQVDLLSVEEWAGNKNAALERPVIDRVVRGLAAKLTDKANILALIEVPEEVAKPVVDGPVNKVEQKKAAAQAEAKAAAQAAAAKEIPDVTAHLLKPIFIARSVGNLEFLKTYQSILRSALPPLLTNHLIPRVQAMIVLGEGGSTDFVDIFQKEIQNKNQTLWVKLWAIEGIKKIKEYGGRLPSDAEAKAAKIVADFLEKPGLPWPIQLRGLEALSHLRQGFLPTQPSKAHMAGTAMRFLADPSAKIEVRAEAARALGLMQITSAVPKYNFPLVAYGTGQLAAELGSLVNAVYPDVPKIAENPAKARYLTALLIGPVYQAFDGITNQRDSGGLLHTASPGTQKYVENVFNLVKPLAQSTVDLLGSPPKQYKDRKKTIASQVAALRAFLDKNPPPSRRLVPDGEEFLAAAEEADGGIVEPAKRVSRGPRGQ